MIDLKRNKRIIFTIPVSINILTTETIFMIFQRVLCNQYLFHFEDII